MGKDMTTRKSIPGHLPNSPFLDKPGSHLGAEGGAKSGL